LVKRDVAARGLHDSDQGVIVDGGLEMREEREERLGFIS
jgi:hypothetical protein